MSKLTRAEKLVPRGAPTIRRKPIGRMKTKHFRDLGIGFNRCLSKSALKLYTDFNALFILSP